MLRHMLLVLFAIILSAPLLEGQGLPVGRRVRVTLVDSLSYVGRVDSAHNGRMWLGASPQAIDLGKTTRIEVSHGRKPKWLLGAGLGAAAGLASALLIKSIVEQGVASDDQLPSILYWGTGTAGGLLIGTGMAFVLARERWEPVPPDRWTPSRPGPNLHAGRGWQLGVSLAH